MTIIDTTTSPTLDPTERARRADAVREARASVRLEGFTLSADWDAQAARFIAGQLSLPEFVAAVQRGAA